MAINVIDPSPRVLRYIVLSGLHKKYTKQISLLSENPRHPGLQVELLEPKERGIYSFRVDRQFRGIFFFIPEQNAIKIVDVNNHYQ